MNLNHFMTDKAQSLKEPRDDPAASYNSFAALPDVYIPEGQRNTVMSHIAGRLVKRYGDTHEARGAFLEKAKCCVPPLDENELDSIWNSAVKFGKAVSAQPGYVPPEVYNDPTPCKPDDYSDVGQAYAFAKHLFRRKSASRNWIVSCNGSTRITSTEKYPTTVFPDCPQPTKPSRSNWKQEFPNWRQQLRKLGNNA